MTSMSARAEVSLYFFLSILFVQAASTGGDEPSGGLFRIEDGAVVIDWSPGVGFSFNSTVSGRNLTNPAGNETNSPLPGSGEGRLDQRGSAPADQDGWRVYGGGLSGAHIGWASRGLQGGGHGRPAEYGRRATDLVGVFSIDMTIKLGSKGPSNSSDAEWISCP